MSGKGRGREGEGEAKGKGDKGKGDIIGVDFKNFFSFPDKNGSEPSPPPTTVVHMD